MLSIIHFGFNDSHFFVYMPGCEKKVRTTELINDTILISWLISATNDQ